MPSMALVLRAALLAVMMQSSCAHSAAPAPAAARSLRAPAAAPGPAAAEPSEREMALGKVVQLLLELRDQVHDDAAVDSKQHGDFVSLTKAQLASASTSIEEEQAKLQQLQASVEAADAFQASKKGELATAGNALLTVQQELELAKKQRLSEQAAFKSSSRTLLASSENINLALESVGSTAGDAAAAFLQDDSNEEASTSLAPGVGLIQATQKLKSALDAGAGELLDAGQRQLLSRLFSVAHEDKQAARRSQLRKRTKAHRSAVSFLQMSSGAQSESDLDAEADLDAALSSAGPSGDFEYRRAELTDLGQTLKKVKLETEAEQTQTHESEKQSVASFAQLSKSLDKEVENRKAAVDELKAAITSSEESESKQRNLILIETRKLTVSKMQLSQLNVDLGKKSKDFEAKNASRAEALQIIEQALQILPKKAALPATSLLQTSTWSQPRREAPSFVQTAQKHRSSRSLASRLLNESPSPGLAAMLLQSRDSLGRKDVFNKVKDMIRDMLDKLKMAQAQDKNRDQRCSGETLGAESSRASKKIRADKLKTTLLSMDAESASLKFELSQTKEQVKDMKSALLAAEELRAQQSDKAKADLIMFKEDRRVLSEAIVVLKRVYGSGHDSVTSLLEKLAAKCKQLEEATDKIENDAKKDFQDVKSTSELRLATFEKDFDFKGQAQTKLSGDTVRATSDLLSYKKEIDALDTYLEELKKSCTVKGATFEDIKQKREQQLSSLKEALGYLKAESL
eukprot:TRINITY_DN15893_c0_g1_i4.p1 TRINITY_DN15893_c0_g1~~TRINITY_DN15893_c0_g1_i4.p1  ORF type:complete len:744 (-),score=229.27 TRINITY_DN15893_c0_g1_i4:37-2268(-)